MRILFLSLFFIALISTITVLTVNSFTGAIPTTPNCPAGHTYAFYRTLEEQDAVQHMWLEAGFVITSVERPPKRFQKSGYKYLLCIRPRTNKELGDYTFPERKRVVTRGASI